MAMIAVCRGVYTMRYGIFVILCILSAVANPAFGASKRCTTVFPLVAKMIPTNACTDDVYSVKALLRNDADCSSWRPTEQDALIVAAADRFVAVGLDGENELVEMAKRRKPGLEVVSVGKGVRRIVGNPYFLFSIDNRKVIEENIDSIFAPGRIRMCGWISVSSVARDRIGTNEYAVAITNPAFEYGCRECGANPVLVDAEKAAGDALYRRQIGEKLHSHRVNLILSLPTDAALDGDFLLCAGARQVRIDVFGDDVSLARLAVALMQGFGDR